MLSGMCHMQHTIDARRSDIARVDAADAPTLMVHLKHDALSFGVGLVKHYLKHPHNEIHGRIVVVQQHYLIKRRGCQASWKRVAL